MHLKLFVFIGLFALCSSGIALKMNEEIEVDGYGLLSAITDQTSVYDRVYGYGDNQVYSRKLTSGDYDQASLETSYTYKNSKGIKDINVSGRYEAGLRMPDGIRHTIWVNSNDSINTTSIISYESGDLVIGKSYIDWDARNATLSEKIAIPLADTAITMASTELKGNFSLFNELEENERMYCTPGVLLEMLEDVEMRGFRQFQEVQTKGPRTIIMDGKSAPADVQASYLHRDALELLEKAANQEDDIKKLEGFNAALGLIDEALEIYPNDAVGWMNKGTTLDYLNRTHDAIKAYEKAISLDDTNPDILFALGELLFASKQYENSIRYLTMGLKINPSRENGWYSLAIAYHHLGDFANAESAIDEHLIRNSGDTEALLIKATIQYQNQSYLGAADSYEKGLAMVSQSEKKNASQDYAQYYLFLGDSYSELGGTEKAKGNDQKAIEYYNMAKARYGIAKDLDENLRDIIDASYAEIEASINSINQGFSDKSPEKIAVTSNITGTANGTKSALG